MPCAHQELHQGTPCRVKLVARQRGGSGGVGERASSCALALRRCGSRFAGCGERQTYHLTHGERSFFGSHPIDDNSQPPLSILRGLNRRQVWHATGVVVLNAIISHIASEKVWHRAPATVNDVIAFAEHGR
jgi:hypothetical protein